MFEKELLTVVLERDINCCFRKQLTVSSFQ